MMYEYDPLLDPLVHTMDLGHQLGRESAREAREPRIICRCVTCGHTGCPEDFARPDRSDGWIIAYLERCPKCDGRGIDRRMACDQCGAPSEIDAGDDAPPEVLCKSCIEDREREEWG